MKNVIQLSIGIKLIIEVSNKTDNVLSLLNKEELYKTALEMLITGSIKMLIISILLIRRMRHTNNSGYLLFVNNDLENIESQAIQADQHNTIRQVNKTEGEELARDEAEHAEITIDISDNESQDADKTRGEAPYERNIPELAKYFTASLNTGEAEQSLNTRGAEQSLNTGEAEQSLNTRGAEGSLNTREAEQSLNTRGAEQSLKITGKEKSFKTQAATKPNRTKYKRECKFC